VIEEEEIMSEQSRGITRKRRGALSSAKNLPNDGQRGRDRGGNRTIRYRTIEVVGNVGHGDERVIVSDFESADEAIGQALALHDARGGYLVVERAETRVVREIGRLDTPRLIVPGSPYYATSPTNDGLYHLRSERGPLPETILFTFDRHARVVMQAIADTAQSGGFPF